MYSQNNNLKPVSFCHGCQVLSAEANNLKQQVLDRDIIIKALKEEGRKLLTILEKWETTGQIKYRQQALLLLKSLRFGLDGNEEEIEEDPIEALVAKMIQESLSATYDKLQDEVTSAYAMISMLLKDVLACQAAMEKKKLENEASLTQNLESMAKLRTQLEGLESTNKTMETEKEQLEKNLEESEQRVKAFEVDIDTYLKNAKENALEAENYRQKQQKIVTKLQNEKDVIDSALKSTLDQVKTLKEELATVSTETSDLKNKFKEFIETTKTEVQDFLKNVKNRRSEEIEKVKKEVEDSYEEQLQELIQLRETCQNQKDTNEKLCNTLITTQDKVEELKEELTAVSTETSNMIHDFEEFINSKKVEVQEFLKTVEKVKQEVAEKEAKELMNLRETCENLKSIIQKSDDERVKKEEEELIKHQEDSKKKTELLVKNLGELKIQIGKRNIMFDSADVDSIVEEKKARLEVEEYFCRVFQIKIQSSWVQESGYRQCIRQPPAISKDIPAAL